jgi:hypothetical protein
VNGVEDEQRAPEPASDDRPDEPRDDATAGPEVTPEAAAPTAPEAETAAEAPEAAPTAEPETQPEPAMPSGRWLVVQTSATLRTVASQNCACFGMDGVPRYGPDETGPARTPAALNVAITLRAGRETRLSYDALRMTLLRSTDKDMVWSGFDAARQLQVLWVWDFYRIQSHVALRAAIPGEGIVPEPWRASLDALRAAGPGDEIELEVTSACGDFDQTHTLARGAVEWEKEAISR